MAKLRSFRTKLQEFRQNRAGGILVLFAFVMMTIVSFIGFVVDFGSGGAHFENALTSINATISSVGDGASQSAPKPFVFLVTDGAQDKQYQYNNGSWSGSNNATTLDASNCAMLKNRGITVAVLYVPYVAIQNPTTIWNNEDGAANANIPKIPPVLQTCATSGFYFTASTPADINTAMQAMFSMAVSSSHLTQ
jgi:hypothetical protein